MPFGLVRHRRRVLHAACALVCIACLVQWLRSDGRAEMVGGCRTSYFGEAGTAYQHVWLQSYPGSVGVRFHAEDDPGPRRTDPAGWNGFAQSVPIQAGTPGGGTGEWSLLGFRFERYVSGKPGDGSWTTAVMVPWALPALLAAALPLRAFARHYRALRRATSNRCRHCGFDLTGGSHVCPECGGGLFPAPP